MVDTSAQAAFEHAKERGSACQLYARETSTREPFLQRARDCSELTLPFLFREENASGETRAVLPWSSFGAWAVNNLASKVVFTLFPPGRPNFKAKPDKRTIADLDQYGEQERADLLLAIESGLSRLEQDTADAIEEDGDRSRMFVSALRLLIGGNHAFQFYDDGTIRGIPLERYVTVRDPQGNLLEWVVLDNMDWETLPDDVRAAYEAIHNGPPPRPENGKRPVKLYTHGILRAGKWHVKQEVLGMDVEGSHATYTPEALPYLFVPWLLLEDEHYGRSYVEMYEGDLVTVEGLTKTTSEGAAALARFVTMVSPVGQTNKKHLAEARNGDVITGREQDVFVLTSQKSADFAMARNEKLDAYERLHKAFLLNSSVQRSGERVTAEEIRYVAQELEDALGGVYAQQFITWQTPYVRLKVAKLQKAKRLPQLPKGTVNLTVNAGLASLARNAELTGLRTGAAILTETFGAEALTQFLKPTVFAKRVFTALGVDMAGLVPTEEELAEAAQASQMQAMMESLGPEALRQVGQNITGNQVAETNAEAKMAQSAPPQQQ